MKAAKYLVLFLISIILSACGEDSVDAKDHVNVVVESADATCSDDDIVGMYYFEYDELSGDCGTITNELVSAEEFKNKSSPGCFRTISHEEKGCRRKAKVSCNNGLLQSSGFLDIEDNGSRLLGKLEITAKYDNGTLYCRSIYSVEAIRQ